MYVIFDDELMRQIDKAFFKQHIYTYGTTLGNKLIKMVVYERHAFIMNDESCISNMHSFSGVISHCRKRTALICLVLLQQ